MHHRPGRPARRPGGAACAGALGILARMKTTARLLSCLIALSLLAACGTKGPLEPPPKPGTALSR